MQRICKENQSELITSEYQHLIDYIDISDFYKHSGSDQGQRCFAIVFLVFLTRFRLTNLICTSLQVLMWRTAFIFVCLQRFSISVKSYASLFRWQVQELHRFMLSLMTFLLCYNHGQRSWDTFAFLGRFPIHTGPTPPSPHKQCWTRVSRIFSEFQLCIGWGEGELQENFENDALF